MARWAPRADDAGRRISSSGAGRSCAMAAPGRGDGGAMALHSVQSSQIGECCGACGALARRRAVADDPERIDHGGVRHAGAAIRIVCRAIA